MLIYRLDLQQNFVILYKMMNDPVKKIERYSFFFPILYIIFFYEIFKKFGIFFFDKGRKMVNSCIFYLHKNS